MPARLMLVAFIAYLAGALSVAVAVLLGWRLRDGRSETRRRRASDLVSGELLSELLRGQRAPAERSRPSWPARGRGSGQHLVS